MILNSLISIIAQGAVTPEITARCLKQLRAVFPCAQLILSTWVGTDVSGLDFDKVVFSADPGAQTGYETVNIPNNVNRQIISTKAGLAAADREFILKTRTDILFHSSRFLEYFGKFDNAPPLLFKNRLLICDFYTRSPRASEICFHPSDWIAFGNADDIRMFYSNLELQSDENAGWFKSHVKKEKKYLNFLSRYTPEQHIFLSFLRQYMTVDFDYNCQCSKEQIKHSEKLFAECFVVLDYKKQLDITFTKYSPNRVRERNTLLRHKHWKAVYEHYCLDISSWSWKRYLIAADLSRMLIALRAFCARMLSFMHLKEPLKRFLGLFGYGK